MKKKMDIQGFAEITRRVIEKDGFDDYLPTLFLPKRRHIVALADIPEEKNCDMRNIALVLAEDKCESGEEYFLAYKENKRQFRIVHRDSTGVREMVFDAMPDERSGM